MAETNGGGLNPRLDRLEAAVDFMIRDHEEFRQEHQLLLRAQVVMQGQLDELRNGLQKLAGAQTELASAQKELASAQKELASAQKELAGAQTATEEKLHVLIATVDDWIRRQG